MISQIKVTVLYKSASKLLQLIIIHAIIEDISPNIAVEAPTAIVSGSTKQLKRTPPKPDPTYMIIVFQGPTVGSNLKPKITCMIRLKVRCIRLACKSIGVNHLHNS